MNRKEGQIFFEKKRITVFLSEKSFYEENKKREKTTKNPTKNLTGKTQNEI